jgi:IS1 family transposase
MASTEPMKVARIEKENPRSRKWLQRTADSMEAVAKWLQRTKEDSHIYVDGVI